MEEIKLGKAYQRDLVVDKRYPVIRTGEQEDKKYVRGDILDANAVQQLIDNILEEDPKAVVERGTGENSVLQKGTASVATALNSAAFGEKTEASGILSFAEGYETKANGTGSHTEGVGTHANTFGSHAEGHNTNAGVPSSPENHNQHSEGYSTQAQGDNSHAEGQYTIAQGNASHAGGISSHAVAQASFVHGDNLIMNTPAGAAFGKFNTMSDEYGENPIFSVGIGTDDDNRFNAFSIYDTYVNILSQNSVLLIGDNFDLSAYGAQDDVTGYMLGAGIGYSLCGHCVTDKDLSLMGINLKRGGNFLGDWDFSNANVTGLPTESGAAYEVINCNITSIDSSGLATVDNPDWFTQASAAYDNNKLPIIKGSCNYVYFTAPLIITEGSPYRECHGTTAATAWIGGGSIRTYVFNFDVLGSAVNVLVTEVQDKASMDSTIASLEARIAALENNQ